MRKAVRPVLGYRIPLHTALRNSSLLDAGVCIGDARVYACLPSVLLVGAMKAGTTEFMEYLSFHPQLRVPFPYFAALLRL